MTTDTEALRQAFEEVCVEDGYAVRSEHGLYWLEPYDEGVLLSLFQAGHAVAKAETTAAVAKERERAAQVCDRRQAALLALVPGARRSNIVRTHEACANTAEVLAQAIRAGDAKEGNG